MRTTYLALQGEVVDLIISENDILLFNVGITQENNVFPLAFVITKSPLIIISIPIKTSVPGILFTEKRFSLNHKHNAVHYLMS